MPETETQQEPIQQDALHEFNRRVNESDEDFIPDPWQKRVLEHNGDIALRTGRQVGKSETVARKAANLSVQHKDITILMISAAQRQSSELFSKALRHLTRLHQAILEDKGGFKPNPKFSPRMNDELRRRFEQKYGIFDGFPTRTEVKLKNGTRLLSLPTGKTGTFIRCYTVDVLIADEAAFIPEPVWIAIKPMLATSKKRKGLGWTILLSTPFGKGGYYWECCHDRDFLQIHISSEQCKRIGKEFLAKERKKMSKMEYAQEYLGEFTDEFNQFFPSDLIKRCMTFIGWRFDKSYKKGTKYFLGVDIARYGADENAFVIAELQSDNRSLKIVKCITTARVSLTDTVGRIMALDKKWDFNRILTDDAGIGAGVTDMLLEKLGKGKVIGINNSKKTIQDDRKKGILKEDLYSHSLALMEQRKLDIISDLKLQRSLKSMTFQYSSEANLKIFGKYSHLSEAMVRACWGLKAKHLKLFLH